MKKIVYVTETRAEFGIMTPLLKLLNGNPEVDLSLIVTGMHLMPEFGYTYNKVEKSGLKIASKLKLDWKGDDGASMAKALGEAIKDRFVWIRLDYQTEAEEKQIVKAKVKDAPEDVIEYSVMIVRETRNTTNLRRGASIRGAIDLASIINEFDERTIQTWIDISIMALATKVELEDGVEEKIEMVIEEIVRKVIGKFFRTK